MNEVKVIDSCYDWINPFTQERRYCINCNSFTIIDKGKSDVCFNCGDNMIPVIVKEKEGTKDYKFTIRGKELSGIIRATKITEVMEILKETKVKEYIKEIEKRINITIQVDKD